MNKFVGWTLIHNENDKCGKCGMKEDASKKGCCKDEHKQLKLAADQQRSTIISSIDVISTPVILQPIYSYDFQINKFEKVTNVYFRPPPLFAVQKLNILYCTFLI